MKRVSALFSTLTRGFVTRGFVVALLTLLAVLALLTPLALLTR